MKVRAIFWVVWALVGLGLEGLALSNDVPNDTLTGTITSHIPAWALFAGVGWVGWHFIAAYLNERDER